LRQGVPPVHLGPPVAVAGPVEVDWVGGRGCLLEACAAGAAGVV
jgi:hypothetical protein